MALEEMDIFSNINAMFRCSRVITQCGSVSEDSLESSLDVGCCDTERLFLMERRCNVVSILSHVQLPNRDQESIEKRRRGFGRRGQ
jgi:hypothetical protein